MGTVIRLEGVQPLRPPVFKIRAHIQVWRRDDPERTEVVIVQESVVTTTPNRRDMEAIARSYALGRLAHIGLDTTKLDDQFLSVELWAARSREYDGPRYEPEPQWELARDDLASKNEAIQNMTYLPYDITEQREVYGA